MKGNQETSLDLLCRCEDLQVECDCANETFSQALDAADELLELARDFVGFSTQLPDKLAVQVTDGARTLIEVVQDLIKLRK